MKDPRDYPSARDWYNDITWEDICARLDAKDAEIEKLKAVVEALRYQILDDLAAVAEAIEPLQANWPEAFEHCAINPNDEETE